MGQGLHVLACGKLQENVAECSQEQAQKKLEELRDRAGGLTQRCGALDAEVKSFDRTEERFNQEYGEEWSRNLLGEYEPGA